MQPQIKDWLLLSKHGVFCHRYLDIYESIMGRHKGGIEIVSEKRKGQRWRLEGYVNRMGTWKSGDAKWKTLNVSSNLGKAETLTNFFFLTFQLISLCF